MEEGDTNGTCSEIEYVATQAMCATLGASEGRRIDGLTRDAGIVGFFWVFGRHARYGGWDEAKVDGRAGSSLFIHQATERSGDRGRSDEPSNE